MFILTELWQAVLRFLPPLSSLECREAGDPGAKRTMEEEARSLDPIPDCATKALAATTRNANSNIQPVTPQNGSRPRSVTSGSSPATMYR